MNFARRIFLPSNQLEADANICPGHPAERASWIWSRNRGVDETAFLRFRLGFRWVGNRPLHLHVTADHRYQLYLDGKPLSYGPDRSDVAHWSVATLEMPCRPGLHELTALVWFIAEAPLGRRMDPKHADGNLGMPNPPMAQMSHRPGFLLCGAEDMEPGLLDTGASRWQVADLTAAVSMMGSENLGYHDIGPAFSFAMGVWNQCATDWQQAAVVARPPVYNIHGVHSPGWVLQSTPLPEQQRAGFSGGCVRAWRPIPQNDAPWVEGGQVDAPDWNECLRGIAPAIISPQSLWEILWDLESYQCGYPALEWSGGAGAEIELAWAEALYEHKPGTELDAETPKGNRNEIDGKTWLGFGDTFVASGANHESSPGLWWRSGRYLRLRIRTGSESLRLERMAILTTGYPLERGWFWESSDANWDDAIELMARGLELGAHETWADSPYYEQMTYVGDNLLHMLSNYVGYRDLRLTRRCLELFDWSRQGGFGGLVAERYPAAWRQESATYAMLYPAMLRNHLFWTGDEEFLRARLPGLRQLIEVLLALRGSEGLLGKVPGWPFIDWVPTWNQGCGSGVREGDSSIVNLHLVLALQAAAAVEEHLGDHFPKNRCDHLAGTLMQGIVERYWDAERHLLRDTLLPGDCPSEHAQVLALLTGLLDAEKEAHSLRHLRKGNLPAQCTVYFSHYLLEVLAAHGEEEAFFRRLQFWRKLPALGLTALPEAPEPSRSDCHGWGAHPFFHTFADIVGIRPSSPGFRTIEIRPTTGSLQSFSATILHPQGEIRVRYKAATKPDRIPFSIALPSGVRGTLFHRGQRFELPLDCPTS